MRKLYAALSGCTLALAAFSSQAVTISPPIGHYEYQTSYTVTNDFQSNIERVMLMEATATSSSLTWAFTAFGGFTSTITNPFTTLTPVISSLVVGIVQDLPNDAPGQKHMVLFMDDAAASNVANIAWGTIFLTTNEDQLIADLELATSGQDWPVIQPGLDKMWQFGGDAQNAQVGPMGTSGSTWFANGGSFTVMAWSDGAVLGHGLSTVTQVLVVPEPETFALMLAGLGVMGFVARRRRS